MHDPAWWVLPILMAVIAWVCTYKVQRLWLKWNLRSCALVQLVPLPLMAPGEGAYVPFLMFGGLYVGVVWLCLIGIACVISRAKS